MYTLIRFALLCFFVIYSPWATGQQVAYGPNHERLSYEKTFSTVEFLQDSDTSLPQVNSSTAFGPGTLTLLAAGAKVGLNYLDTYKKRDLEKYSAQHSAIVVKDRPFRKQVQAIHYSRVGSNGDTQDTLESFILLPKVFRIGSDATSYFIYEIDELKLAASDAKTTRKNPYVDLIVEVEIAYIDAKGKQQTAKSSPIQATFLSTSPATQNLTAQQGTLRTSLLPRNGYIHTVTVNVSEKNSYKISESRWFSGFSGQADAIEALIKAFEKSELEDDAATATDNTK